jgi:hypothetical protein
MPRRRSRPASIVIREPQSMDDLIALNKLRLVQGEEMAQAPVNPAKVMDRLIEASKDGSPMLLAFEGEELAGYLLLERRRWDYSDEPFLGDFGFYVRRSHRGGEVGKLLLRDAREVSRLAGMPLYLMIITPGRGRRTPSGMERVAAMVGYSPTGALIRIE